MRSFLWCGACNGAAAITQGLPKAEGMSQSYRHTQGDARLRLGLKGRLALALLPTLTVLAVLALLEAFSQQRVLFASLASSAFLIYRDPLHQMNSVRTMVLAQVLGSTVGVVITLVLGPGYIAGGSAMVVTIVLLIVLDAVHPPAISTALTFAFRAEDERTIVLFGLALGLVAVLVVLQQAALFIVRRFHHG